MDKQLLPSIEKFAAYLDGNLSQDEMLQFSHLASNNEDLKNLLDTNTAVEDTLENYDESDLTLPAEIANMDFDLPEIENFVEPNFTTDSFSENQSLYQYDTSDDVEKILEDVFDDEDSETEIIDDLDIDLDTDILDDF